ncbi:MAG: hydantoinase B/oxoprolinase family protein, partial [Thermomicrobiales bacterium]
GGRSGSMIAVEILHADGSPNYLAGKTARYTLKKGDVARLITGTGGGWGDPRQRDHALVLEDIRDGLVSVETARTVYGLTEEDLAAL